MPPTAPPQATGTSTIIAVSPSLALPTNPCWSRGRLRRPPDWAGLPSPLPLWLSQPRRSPSACPGAFGNNPRLRQPYSPGDGML